jgi:putative addiction module CopG family antidote
MTLTIPPEIEKLIDEQIRSGRYQSAEEVVAAAICSLEYSGDLSASDLERLLAEGENSPPLDGLAVLKELRDLRQRGKAQ